MLGKLMDLPQPYGLVLNLQTRETWARDLRRFFVANMILPARAAFLNRKDTQTLNMAIEVTNLIPTVSSPVMFNLILKAPRINGEASAKKDNEDWVQKAFEALEEPLRAAAQAKRNEVVKKMLEMTDETGVAVPSSNLRTVCEEYALATDKTDWALVSRVAHCDTDVFLLAQEGHGLLDSIFERMHKSEDHNEQETKSAISFAVSLVQGAARARDLPGFLKRWFENLSLCFSQQPPSTLGSRVWASAEVGKTVAGLLQPSMSPKQLQSYLDWLVSHTGQAEDSAVLVILDAIADGITGEDLIDAVETRLFDESYRRDASGLSQTSKASARWNIARKTLSWVTLEQANALWPQLEDELRQVLLESRLGSDSAPFATCFEAWLANYPGGKDEAAAADLAIAALGRLNGKIKGMDSTARDHLLGKIVSECPRLIEYVYLSA
jgi:nucleolar pre-ribosomal-associated protein 2